MGLFDRFKRPETRDSLENPGNPLDPRSLSAVLGAIPTASGASITTEGSLRIVAVYACVRVIAETLASLPLFVYRRLPDGGKEVATGHPLSRVLHDDPNPLMTAFEFREAMLSHLLLWGNAYAEIRQDAGRRAGQLWPLRPDKMKVEKDGGRLRYVYELNGSDKTFEDRTVMHWRGLSPDGVKGYSPISLAREALGRARATEDFSARFFLNGARPGGILQHPSKLSPEAHSRLRQAWEEIHAGPSNAHKVAILEEGMTYEKVGIPPNEAQWIEAMGHSVVEVARLFRVPPHMIQDLGRATWGNIEHQAIDFVVHTIRPWAVRVEQAMMRDLLDPRERATHFIEHKLDGLLRGDTATRYAGYHTALEDGWLNRNEVRSLENRNPIEGGDTYRDPAQAAAPAPREDPIVEND